MSEQIIKARFVGRFDGANVTGKGILDLKFKLPYDELPEYIAVVKMLNNVISIKTQIPAIQEKAVELGDYRVKHLNIDGDGEAKFCLTTATEYAEMNNVNDLSRERGTDIVINLVAIIESDEEEEATEEEWNEEDDKSVAAVDWQDNESWGDDDENDNDGWD